MIGDNKVKDSRGVRLLSEISLYVVYRLITYYSKLDSRRQFSKGMEINQLRNIEGTEHVERLKVFPVKLELVQVAHVLGLNVLVLVG